jgi:DNA-binding CsgD family transcriptional regulator
VFIPSGDRPDSEPRFPPLTSRDVWDRFVHQHHLTPRESQILALVCRGCGYETICAKLGISRATLRTHLRAAYEKTRCRNRVELILTLVHHPSGAGDRGEGAETASAGPAGK